jgi:hypothetical protein
MTGGSTFTTSRSSPPKLSLSQLIGRKRSIMCLCLKRRVVHTK